MCKSAVDFYFQRITMDSQDGDPVWVPMVAAPPAFASRKRLSLGSYSRLPAPPSDPEVGGKAGGLLGWAGKQPEEEGAVRFSADDDEDTRCGVWSWRPSWLQRFANLGAFTFVLSVMNLWNGVFNAYFNAIVTSIENRFGLSSSTMGFLKNADNIGYLCTIMILSHFCRYANKPKLFTFACITSGIATLLFAFPHFMYGAGDSLSVAGHVNGTLMRSPGRFARFRGPRALTYFCDTSEATSVAQKLVCEQKGVFNALGTFNAGALAFFIISQLIQGVSNAPCFTLSVTYMDDNAKGSSAMHLGVLFAIRALSPLLGYALGAWAISMYVDLSGKCVGVRVPE